MPNIIKQDDWLAISDEESFTHLLPLVQNLDPSLPSDWVKWKSTNGSQVVIQTPDFFYKVYEAAYSVGVFECAIREKLAEIYRELGLHWEIKTIRTETGFFQVEQRQKLEVAHPQEGAFYRVLGDWKEILRELSKRLQLKRLTAHLKPLVEGLDEVMLLRDCLNKFIDYGVFKGHYILLDDADWYLQLINDKSERINQRLIVESVEWSDGTEMTFAPFHWLNFDPASFSESYVPSKWFLFALGASDSKRWVNHMIGAREKMLADNIRLLRGEVALTDGKTPEALYVERDPGRNQLR